MTKHDPVKTSTDDNLPETESLTITRKQMEAAGSGDELTDEDHAAPRVLFPLGAIVATPGAIDLMERNGIAPAVLLEMHQAGDWGDVCAEDARQNVLSLKHGLRVLSAYRYGPAQDAIWVITEADRSVTTFLLPSEY